MHTVIAALIGASVGTCVVAGGAIRWFRLALLWPTLVSLWLLFMSTFFGELAPRWFPSSRFADYIATHPGVLFGFLCIFGYGAGLLLRKYPGFFYRPLATSSDR